MLLFVANFFKPFKCCTYDSYSFSRMAESEKERQEFMLSLSHFSLTTMSDLSSSTSLGGVEDGVTKSSVSVEKMFITNVL